MSTHRMELVIGRPNASEQTKPQSIRQTFQVTQPTAHWRRTSSGLLDGREAYDARHRMRSSSEGRFRVLLAFSAKVFGNRQRLSLGHHHGICCIFLLAFLLFRSDLTWRLI